MDRIDELLLLEADEFDFFETEIIRNESIDKADMQHLQIRLFRCCAVKEHEERFKALIRRESIDKVTMQFNARIRTAEQMETAWRKNDSYKKLKERLKADEAKKRAASLIRPFNVEEQRSIEDANIHGCINNNNNNNNNTGIQSISSDDNSTLSDGPLPLPTTSTSVTKRSRRRRNRGRGKKNGIYSTPAASVKEKNPALYGFTKNSNTPTTTTTTQHTNVHKNDVLYGNGNTIVAHDGIKNIKPKYSNYYDLSQVEWNEIVIGIYNKVTSDSDDELDDSKLAGRFLKLKSSNGIYSLWDTMDEQKPLNSAWEIMSTQDAIEMIVRDMFWAIMSEQKRDERCKQLLRLQPKYIELFDSQDDTTNDQRNSINMNVTTTPNNAATVDDGITKGRLDEIPTTNTVQENMNALSVPNMKWKQIASYPDKKRSIYLFTSDDVDDDVSGGFEKDAHPLIAGIEVLLIKKIKETKNLKEGNEAKQKRPTELEKVHQKSTKKAHDGTTSNKEKITKIQKEMDSKVEQFSLVPDQNGSSDDAAKRTTFVPGEQGSASAATSSSSSSGVIRENTLRVSSPSNQVEKKGNSSSDDTSSDSDCSCGDGGIGSTSTKNSTTSLLGTAPAQDEFIDPVSPVQQAKAKSETVVAAVAADVPNRVVNNRPQMKPPPLVIHDVMRIKSHEVQNESVTTPLHGNQQLRSSPSSSSLIGTAPAQEVIDLTNPFQKRFSRAPNRFDPSEKPKTTKPKTIDKKRHNTRYILRCLTQPNLNLMVENYAKGNIKCPSCSDMINVGTKGCKVITCTSQKHRPNYHFFCYHCKAACVGDIPSCLCSHSNGDKARRIEQEKETCWGFKKYH
jgi:hypothetical protein